MTARGWQPLARFLREPGRGSGPGSWRALVVAGLLAVAAALHPSPASANPPNVSQVAIENVSDTSFSVSWVTDQLLPSGGAVVYYGTSQAASSLTSRTNEQPIPGGARGDVHQAVITGLQAATTYYFYVWIAGSSYQNASGAPYSQKTAASTSTNSPNRRATGRVAEANSSAGAPGVLVAAQVYDPTGLNSGGQSTSATLATLTDSNGNWSILLDPRTVDGSSFFQYQTSGASDVLQISVTGGSLGSVPLSSQPLSFDSTGTLTLANPLSLELLTPSPTSANGTFTSTPSATSTSTATPTPTLAVRPTESPTSTRSPTSTDSPTVAPVPPSSTPVPPTPVIEEPAAPAPPPVSGPPTMPPAAPAVPTLVLVAPSRPAPPTASPFLATVPAVLASSGAVPTIPPVRTPALSPTPRASPFSATFPYQPEPTPPPTSTAGAELRATPSPIALSAAPVDPFQPLQQIIGVIASGVGFAGLGVALLVIGVVHQWRGQ